jgi:DNA invertase Pin-like site-specific DNA recombinase
MVNVIGYGRVSSKKQEDEGFSIPAQVELMTEYARQKGLNIVKIFTESETAKRAGRKAFNEMLDYIKESGIKTILVEKTDRLYRNFKDYVTLEDYDLEVHLIKEGTVLSKNSKSHEKFIHGIKVLMAKNYIDNLSEEVKKGKNEKAKQGYYPQQAPVGYVNTDGSNGKRIIVPDSTKSHYIVKLFELYNTGVYSITDLRKKLFAEGFNHKGKPYSKARLLAILHDCFYIGKFVYNGVVYDGKHEPLISIDLFNSVQSKFNQSKAKKHDTEFLYTGLLNCGHCGCQLTAELKKGKYIYYHCTGKRGGNCKKDYIREEQIDDVFMDLIKKIPKPEEKIFDLIRKGIKESRILKSEYEEINVEEIQKQINRLQKRIDNLYLDKLDGNVTEEYWKEKHNLWYSEKDNLIEKLKEYNNTAKTFDEGIDLLENFCKNAPEMYKRSCPKTKKKILKVIGSNFYYKDKKVSVVLNSVFDLLINSAEIKALKQEENEKVRTPKTRTTPNKKAPFGANLNNGGVNKPMLELRQFTQFIYKLKTSINQDLISVLKIFKNAV